MRPVTSCKAISLSPFRVRSFSVSLFCLLDKLLSKKIIIKLRCLNRSIDFVEIDSIFEEFSLAATVRAAGRHIYQTGSMRTQVINVALPIHAL